MTRNTASRLMMTPNWKKSREFHAMLIRFLSSLFESIFGRLLLKMFTDGFITFVLRIHNIFIIQVLCQKKTPSILLGVFLYNIQFKNYSTWNLIGKEYNTPTDLPRCLPGVILGSCFITRTASSSNLGCGARACTSTTFPFLSILNRTKIR